MEANKKSVRKKKAINIEKLSLWISIISGICSVLLAIIYGGWGVHLSNKQITMAEKQDSTSISLDTFKKLLLKTDVIINQQSQQLSIYQNELNELRRLVGKTDTVMIVAGKQLLLNRLEQERSNQNYTVAQIGEMNRLNYKSHQINEFAIFDLPHITDRDVNIEKVSEWLFRYEEIKQLFYDEMKNSYLNSSDTLVQLWTLAYNNIGDFLQQMKINRSLVGRSVFNLNKNQEEVAALDTAAINNYIRIYGLNLKLSISAAVNYAMAKIKRDKITNGLLDKTGHSKIDPMIFWH